MDPHSRFSQFNSRQPKAGPAMTDSRYMESSVKNLNPLENFKKRTNAASSSKRSPSSPLLNAARPIVTNSRIKQDEQYRKDMHLAFITNALQQKSRGISDAFDELVDQFNLKKTSTDAPSPAPQLRLWILALSNIVSRLERCHLALIEAVVGTPWTTMDATFVKSYTAFIGMLVSAKPEYLATVLKRLAHGLTYQSGLQALDAGLPESSSSPLTRRVVYDRIHYLLRHLLSLVPTLPSTLQPLLVLNFPHKRQSQAAQVTYIRNLLRVTEYCPELADRILSTIVDRAIQIDVEIQVELEELEEQFDNQEAEIFDLDPFDTVVGQEGEESDDEGDSDEDGNLSDLSSDAGEGGDDDGEGGAPELQSDFKQVSDMVNKLDAILKNVFDHFNYSHGTLEPVKLVSLSSSPSRSDSPAPPPPEQNPRPPSPGTLEKGRELRRSQFYTLLSIFDRIILRTFKSRYTQFLIFWYSSLDPEFSDTFQGVLVSKALLEEDQPAVTRAAAASYIASFVSRAQFVDGESARRVVACLCEFLKSRLDTFDALQQLQQSGAGGGVGMMMMMGSGTQNSVFYAVAQAVFLIFCFRWRDLVLDQEEMDEVTSKTGSAPRSKWLPELDVLQRVVLSELNPLKMCSPPVVMQFAKVAHATDFLYCYSIIEANKRSDFAPNPANESNSNNRSDVQQQRPKGPLMHPSILGGNHSMHMELNTFFPFDPYKLPRSSPYIQGVYREWSDVAIDEDEDEDEDEEEDQEEEQEGEDEHSEDDEEKRRGAMAISDNGAPTSVVVDEDTEGLGASFGGMSISPARSALSGMPMSLS